MGGFDEMTARLGGLWDSLLGEGRRWWITSTSDSHRHYTEGGSDFWTGEYSKTYVHAGWDYADILDGLRNGRIFVIIGDLIDQLDLTVSRTGQGTGTPTATPPASARPSNFATTTTTTTFCSTPTRCSSNADLPRRDGHVPDAAGLHSRSAAGRTQEMQPASKGSPA